MNNNDGDNENNINEQRFEYTKRINKRFNVINKEMTNQGYVVVIKGDNNMRVLLLNPNGFGSGNKDKVEMMRKAKKDSTFNPSKEEEQRKRMEKIRKEQAIKEKLRQLRPCPAGFNWYKQGAGWRCGGGSHYVSDAELNKSFTS